MWGSIGKPENYGPTVRFQEEIHTMNPFRIYGRTLSTLFVCLCILMAGSLLATAQAEEDATHSFTYQGQLYGTDGVPVTGQCDFIFSLYDAVTDGGQVGVDVTLTSVQVAKGIFSADLDFGVSAFNGGSRWLEIGVKCSPAAAFSTLSPRQPISPTPYAHYAYRSPWSGLTGIPTDIADGDDDTLATLDCSTNQLALWNGTAWACAAPVGHKAPKEIKGIRARQVHRETLVHRGLPVLKGIRAPQAHKGLPVLKGIQEPRDLPVLKERLAPPGRKGIRARQVHRGRKVLQGLMHRIRRR
jgi:hypothetical protein